MTIAMIVTEDGVLFKLGLLASCAGIGVRPAVWINI